MSEGSSKPDHGRTILRVFPADDRRLAADAERAYLELKPEAANQEDLRAAVEAALRRSYPNVRIQRRDAIAALSSADQPWWYVLRDQRVRIPDPGRDRLYEALGASREVIGRGKEAGERASEMLRDATFAVGRSRRRRGDTARQRGEKGG
jgi:hypothetical protein